MKWIILALVLVLIAVMVWMLLRKPSGGDGAGVPDGGSRDEPRGEGTDTATGAGMDPSGTQGYAAPPPDEHQETAAPPRPASSEQPYDQTQDSVPTDQPGSREGDTAVLQPPEPTYTDTATGAEVPASESTAEELPPPGRDDLGHEEQGHPGPDSEPEIEHEEQGHPGPDSEPDIEHREQGHPGPDSEPWTEPVEEHQGHPGAGSQEAAFGQPVEQHPAYPSDLETRTGEDRVAPEAQDTSLGEPQAESQPMGTAAGATAVPDAYPEAEPEREPTRGPDADTVAPEPADDTWHAAEAEPHAGYDAPVADDYGYDQAHEGQMAAGGFQESPYGPGSALPAGDGTGPQGWPVKGNSGSMLFHTPDSPSYATSSAEVWFESEEAARNAGFAHWDRKQR